MFVLYGIIQCLMHIVFFKIYTHNIRHIVCSFVVCVYKMECILSTQVVLGFFMNPFIPQYSPFLPPTLWGTKQRVSICALLDHPPFIDDPWKRVQWALPHWTLTLINSRPPCQISGWSTVNFWFFFTFRRWCIQRHSLKKLCGSHIWSPFICNKAVSWIFTLSRFKERFAMGKFFLAFFQCQEQPFHTFIRNPIIPGIGVV